MSKFEIYRIQKKEKEGVSLLRIVLSFAWKQYFGATKKETRSYRFEQTRLSCHCSYRKMWPGKKIKLGKIYNSDCGEILRRICRSSRFIEVEIKGSTVLILENPTIVCSICLSFDLCLRIRRCLNKGKKKFDKYFQTRNKTHNNIFLVKDFLCR